MNEIFNEVSVVRDTSRLTPIEIALGIDNEGEQRQQSSTIFWS